MPPKRFFLDASLKEGGEVVLEGDEFNHAKNVLRLSVGDEVTLLDGSGRECSAIIAKAEKRYFVLHVTGEHVCDREPQKSVYLLVGALKGDKTELVVQKATELGVAKIGVFNSQYCSAYMNGNKLERLNKVAREAAKQCLRSVAPKVEYFEKFEDALSSAEGCENKLFFCEFAFASDKDISQMSGSAALIVGSEGGFTEEEFSLAKNKYGFAGITLGKRILRAETAAITACALAAFALGELK